ncbi:MAG TPA: asparagine synthase (glutamine-hydrolyzing) [Patescibacteria group bacterium]|nr:asparagine synthase (glutamine-hydrolyzing) [Gammaproteobacteria bacterium]HWA52502.1 asparagine synthase (glutamine-hydrolyzing) [Patescibacteria group bacterium]
MCGIVAYLSKNLDISKETFKSAINTLNHRGPDFHGLWVSDDSKLALGHARLSIIDLLTGNQPLRSKDDNIVIVVNGEFYQYEIIKRYLQKKGFEFQTESDSEILIYLYQLYGVNCLEFLRGEFSFVLWDDKNKYIFAARDRCGIKPLFYSMYQDALYLSSEIKALLTLGVPCKWDLCSIISWENLLPLENRSLFENIFSINPGHFILATPDNIQIKKYWDFNYPKEGAIDDDIDENKMINEFRKELEEAVTIRLRSDVPVGCYLSGGLDSSAILGLMIKHSKSEVDAFTISFDHDLYDEAKIAEETAKFVGARSHVFKITNQLLSENFFSAIYQCESFILNNNTIAKFLLSKFTRESGYKTVMTGEGSDEILGGYPMFREDILKYGFRALDHENRNKLVEHLYENNPAFASVFSKNTAGLDVTTIQEILGYVPSMFKMGAKLGEKLITLHNENFSNISRNFDAQINFINQLDQDQVMGRDVLSKSLYLWAKSILPGLILVNLGDRMEMAHSIEGRVPFLDHKLLEFLVNIPSSLKIKGLTEKFILREAVKDIITPTIYQRQKHPFKAPHPTLTLNPFTELMLDVFNGNLLKYSFIYDQSKVLKQFNMTQSMPEAEREQWDVVFMFILSQCVLQSLFKPLMPN